MKEYKCVCLCFTGKGTENMLNKLAKDGWHVVCSYAMWTRWLILEREVKK